MRRALILAPVLATALLAGCSSSSDGGTPAAPVAGATQAAATVAPTPEPFEGKSPAEIFDAAKAEAGKAKSVHVVGTVLDGTDKVKYDLRLSKAKGGLADGTMTVEGDKISVRRIGKAVYFKAGKHFYMEQGGVNSTVANLVAGKWIKTSKSEKSMQDFVVLTELDGPAATGVLALPKADRAALKKVDGKTIGGQETVGLYDQSDDPTEEGTLYVSTGDRPLPLELSGNSGQKITFSDWDKAVTVTAPAGAMSV